MHEKPFNESDLQLAPSLSGAATVAPCLRRDCTETWEACHVLLEVTRSRRGAQDPVLRKADVDV